MSGPDPVVAYHHPMTQPTGITVKIGVLNAAREIELSVADVESFVANLESALVGEHRIWWVTESDGRRHGFIVDKITHVDIEAERNRTIGFG